MSETYCDYDSFEHKWYVWFGVWAALWITALSVSILSRNYAKWSSWALLPVRF